MPSSNQPRRARGRRARSGDRAEQAVERRAVPELRPGARREQVRRAPVGRRPRRSPRLAAQSSTVAPSASPTPAPRASGSTAAKPRNPALSGRTSPLCSAGDADRAADRGADDAPVDDGDEGGVIRVVEVLLPLGRSPPRAAAGRAAEKTGESCWCAGSASSSSASTAISSRVGRRISMPVGQLGEGRLGGLADRVDVLLAEAEPEPRVDERGVARRERSRSATCAPPRPSGPPRARRDRARPRPRDTACPAGSTQTFGPQVGSSRGVPSR